MTAPTPALVPASNGHHTDAELREVARDVCRAELAAGRSITGAELAERFGKSERWGRARLAETRRDPASDDPAAASRDDQPEDRDAQHQARDDDSVSGDRQAPARDGAPAPVAAPGSPGGDGDPARSWLDSTVTLAVALVAAAASYGHMLHVALLAGEPLWIARAWPVTVDGLVVAALRCGHRGRNWLVAGLLVSVAANVLAQHPDHIATAGPIVAAWPPIALFGTHRLYHRRPAAPKDRRQP